MISKASGRAGEIACVGDPPASWSAAMGIAGRTPQTGLISQPSWTGNIGQHLPVLRHKAAKSGIAFILAKELHCAGDSRKPCNIVDVSEQ